MKRILLILLCLAFWIPSNASMVSLPYVQDVQAGMVVGSGGGGATCDTAVATNTGATAISYDITDSDSYYFVGHHFFDDADTHTICKVTLYLTLGLGDISGKTYTCYIYTIDGSGNLDALQATSTGVTGSNAWSDTAVDFEFPSPATFGQDYAIVLSTGSVDAANYATLSFTASGGFSGLYGRWQSDGTRTSSGSYDVKAVFYE